MYRLSRVIMNIKICTFLSMREQWCNEVQYRADNQPKSPQLYDFQGINSRLIIAIEGGN
jgi:hypothetical protein